ncbi:TonB-dependent receptor [Sphingomonas morindae]|uniref:TonB-dependent receptor n=1 Tax=Sphingomonas morindae TaxID=1541170 RepID=A0ABY4XD49_9SPHN|nr:TonB-dependent receptor [Sphingomonas morindae]USI74843.1 TonB-dependent receptor [Sphingomonas morindae]
MLKNKLLFAAAPLALLIAAHPAAAATPPAEGDEAMPGTPAAAPAKKPSARPEDIIVTGVAIGRDRLDSATSTSALRLSDIARAAPRSVAEIFRNIPGIRSESSGGEGNANISIRGLPIASGGAKFLQLQEDGLPVLEFGDITFGNADIFMRADLMLDRVETIRGGSASTFASNSPGGVINLITLTGEREGGALQTSFGINYKEYRTDFTYGGRLAEGLRFQIGGFYRQGTGPHRTGFDGLRGGQLRGNITKTFDSGYVRLSFKLLDDRATSYLPMPIRATGTDSDPKYQNIQNFKLNRDLLLSPYIPRNITLDENNQFTADNMQGGHHPKEQAVGLETRFSLAGFTITDRFRYAAISGRFISPFPAAVDNAGSILTALGGAGATLAYASGPNAGQVISNPAALNGNGLLARIVIFDTKLNSLDNATNDLRASRVDKIGGGDLTTTVGLYRARQTINTAWLWTEILTDVRGDGKTALIDVRNAAGAPITQNGFVAFSANSFGNCCRRRYNLDYTVTAPFGSLNYHFGRISIGGSLRLDTGTARGSVSGSDLGGGRIGLVTQDMNGDGVITPAEQKVAILPLGSPAPVNYDYSYLSYSAGIVYRLAEPLAVFGRYSRGGRANADRLLFGPAVRTTDGGLVNKAAAVDFVRQAELGVKFREAGLQLNLTGFWASTAEQNFEATSQTFINRTYRALGLEFDGGYRVGPFSLTAGATWTHAEISKDALHPEFVGHTPRRQAKLIFQATPQLEHGPFTLGANFIGTTSSYTADSNQLKMPGYVTTNAFVTYRPLTRLLLSLNANNLFDVLGLTEAEDATLPANGIVRARAINGRTISTSLRLDF